LLWRAGALALAACLLCSGKYLFDARQVARDAAALRGEAALARRQYDEIVKTFPDVPIEHETLKHVIDHYLAEERRSTTPTAFYREISLALQAEPAIEIDRLDWKIGIAAPGAAGSGDPGAAGFGAPGTARAPPEDGESLVVRGTLRLPARAGTRQLLAAFNRFVEALRANAGLRVEILEQPFDIASGASLRGGDALPEEAKPREFGLLVTRRSAP
ncbi:MAG: hypothetical protein LBQ62_08800, partial [Candidatus Accumulibacter sp.]|nr:hypothetical protein [Accumulibacter sp.]